MTSLTIYEYLERISSLLRTDVRRSGIGLGLQPVQLEALHYLGRCNRYSDTPLAVADYLGLTKGTVSQTLGILESNKLIEKQPDTRDKRIVHVRLTQMGQNVLEQSVPPRVLETALASLSEAESEALMVPLNKLLSRIQQANGLKSFGACMSCRHHELRDDSQRHCALTNEPLSELDAGKICREHTPPPSESGPD